MSPANKRRNTAALLLLLLLLASCLSPLAAEGSAPCPERVYFPYLTSVASNNGGVGEITLNRRERTYVMLTVPQLFYGSLESAELEIVTTAIVAPIPIMYDIHLASGRDYTNLLEGAKVGSVVLGPDTASRSISVPLNEAFLNYLQQAAAANTGFVFLEFGATLNSAVQTNAYLEARFARFKVSISPTNAPVFAIEPQNYEMADGGVVQLFTQAEPCAEYQWQHNGENVPFAREAFLPVFVSPETVGEYRVIARNAFGASTSGVYRVSLGTAAPTLVPSDTHFVTALLGEAFQFCVNVQGSPRPSVQWYFNDVLIPGATSACLPIDNIRLDQAGNYRLVASNAVGTAGVTVQLNVFESVPFIVGDGQFVSVVEGGTVHLPIHVFGGPKPDTYILKDGTNVLLPDFTILAARMEDAGWYSFIASNRLGVVTSALSRVIVTPAGPLDRWTELNPLPQGNELLSIASGNGALIAVGRMGTMLGGTTGNDLALLNRRTDNDLSSIVFGDGRFVASGPSSLLTSEDGANWTHRPHEGPGMLAMAYGNGEFVAAGPSGILRSPDGITWARDHGISTYLTAVAYGNGVFVAAGDRLYISSGETWTHVEPAPWIESIAFLNGQFVAVGEDGGIATSTDGTRWQIRNSGTERRLIEAAYGNGRYVVVGTRGTVLTSPDATNWTLRDSGTPDRLETIHFSDGMFTAAGENGTTITSPDGITWAKRNFGTTRDLDGMVITPHMIVVVGKAGTILTSTNGIDFNEQQSGTTNNLHAVGWNTNLFVAVGEPGAVLTSPDGIQWTVRDSGVTNALKRVKYGGNIWVAVGAEGTIIFSPDGIEWNSVPRQNFTDLNDVAYGNGKFLVVGDQFFRPDAALWESLDGIHWEFRSIPLSKNARTVHFADPYFMIGANDGMIAFSTNTTRWTHVETMVDQNLRDISFQNGQWMIVGNRGAIQTSTNLAAWSWTEHFSRARENLHGAGLFRGHYFAIGNRGTIIRSGMVPTANLTVVLTDTSLEVQSSGTDGFTYELQSSTDLETWTKITEVTGSTLKYQEPVSAFKSAQFFRVLQK